MRIVLKGISHRTAPVGLREQLAIERGRLAEANRALCGVRGVREGLIISTCNRMEVVVCHGSELPDLSRFLAEYFGIDSVLLAEHTYEYHEIDAVQHLFRVVSSLDSLVLGEPQILGQVKDAYTAARSVGAVRSNLDRLLQSAFSVAKKVRSETSIGNAPVSIASVVINLVKRVFGSLTGRRILLVGAGKMSELAAIHLTRQGAGSIRVANRTYDHALMLAGRFGGHAIPFEDVQTAAAEADIVITSTGAPEYIFRCEHVPALMRSRRNRPLFFVDIAVPRNVDPEIGRTEGIFVYDVDSLQSVASANQEERHREAENAEMIVAQEAIRYLRRTTAFDVAPMIRELQAWADAIVNAELDRAQSKLRSLTPDQQRATERVLRGMMNKFLHPVIRNLKQAAEEGDGERMEAICNMFELLSFSKAPAEAQMEREVVPFVVPQLKSLIV